MPNFPFSKQDIADGKRHLAEFMDSPEGALAKVWLVQTHVLGTAPNPKNNTDRDHWFMEGRRDLAKVLSRLTNINPKETTEEEQDDER